MNEEKSRTDKENAPEQVPQDHGQGHHDEEERDRLDELLADVPEWLRGPIKLYYRQILVTIALVVVGASLLSGYSYYVQRQEAAASYQLGLAMASTDLDEKINSLKLVQESFSHTDAARLAGLLLGQVYLQKEKWDLALDAFDRAQRDFEGIMADTAAMGKGYSFEEKKELDKALAVFKQVSESKNGMEAVATLDEARILKQLGKKEEAVKAFDRYLDLAPQSPFLDFIRYQVMNLSS